MQQNDHWLDDYASDRFKWQSISRNGRNTFHRPLGLVEFAFDADGRYYEGRADLNVELVVEVKSRLSKAELREGILLAWTYLRCQHLLLQARTTSEFADDRKELNFAVDVCGSVDDAVRQGKEWLVFLDDHYEDVDPLDFWTHCQNTARIIDPAKALAKCFVLAPEALGHDRYRLRLLTVGSHQIMDGLTVYNWQRDFVHLLNKSTAELRDGLRELIRPEVVVANLPLPQEALYPPIAGSRPRQRWFWVITRVLRHVRKPLDAGFSNPLRRKEQLEAIAFSPVYEKLLDYSRTPPFNAYTAAANTSLRNTQRLHRLCREANASIGAGCFALAALTMMEMYERLEPNIPLQERKPFISGFPLNPRAFFNHHNEPNSLMLAFCDGIALPFLSSSLDLNGRIRLLARQAHRQLSSFQKRRRPAGSEAELQYMSSRGAGRVLANQYLQSLERVDMAQPEHLRKGVSHSSAYPPKPNMTMQTCGVSSVGRRDAVIKRGMYNLSDGEKDFVADFRDVTASVRPRNGECLIGVAGTEMGLRVHASVDMSTNDVVLVKMWQERFEHILDYEEVEEKARL